MAFSTSAKIVSLTGAVTEFPKFHVFN